MKIHFWPKTNAGKWASVLTLLFIILMYLKYFALDNAIRLPLPSPVLAVLPVIAFVMGIMAIFKKDRSLLVLLSIPIGLLVIIWVAAEIAFPH